MSEKMSAENRAKTLERFLDKFPWSGFAHGALVKCITAAEEAAYADGQREMRENAKQLAIKFWERMTLTPVKCSQTTFTPSRSARGRNLNASR